MFRDEEIVVGVDKSLNDYSQKSITIVNKAATNVKLESLSVRAVKRRRVTKPLLALDYPTPNPRATVKARKEQSAVED